MTPFTLGVVMNENEDTADLNRGFKGRVHYIHLGEMSIGKGRFRFFLDGKDDWAEMDRIK